MAYRSPFITETNEPALTDCQICAGLMLVAEWTAGEAIHDRHGNTLDALGLKRLRERIRVLSGDTDGGASLEEAVADLAAPPPAVDPGPLPEVASAVSGRTWAFPENPYVRSVRLDFESPTEALATVEITSERDIRVDPLGLDGVVRSSQGGRPIVATGRWVDDSTFEMDVEEGPGFHRYQLRLRFEGDSVELGVLGETIKGTAVLTDG